MVQKVGLIGIGNMGLSMIRGVIASGYLKPSQIIAYDLNHTRLDELLSEQPDISIADNAAQAAAEADLVILAVKPQFAENALKSIVSVMHGKSLVSIVAGWTFEMLNSELSGAGTGIIRVMPNMPAMVGEGMTALCDETTLSRECFEYVLGFFNSIGKTIILPERLFDGATALSGSSPAIVYMFIEALADAGVREGFTRASAYEMAAQSVLGSALMVLSSGTHPAGLKDAVCSPGGTAIEAVSVLESKGFRGAVIDAVHECAEKSRKFSKQRE